MSMVEYECLPSYSNMQFAEISDIDGSIIVPRFAMRSGTDFQDTGIALSTFALTFCCTHTWPLILPPLQSY